MMRMKSIVCFSLGIVFSLALNSSVSVQAQSEKGANPSAISKQEWQAVVDKGVAYLRSQGQGPDGAFSKQSSLGVTGLVTAGLLSVGVSPQDPVVAKSLDYLMKHRQKDGGFYLPESKHSNYETCIAMLALSKANTNGKYKEELAAAERYIKGMQWDETEEKNKEDLTYGGAGYGSKSRPDLSNTAFFIDALKSVGRDENDEAIQRALLFVTRCQNLESPQNSAPFASLNNDGGFYYTPAAGGDSMAGKTPNGGLRSYASMTYAGLKSMIFAGVTKDDPRVKASIQWLHSNYAVDSNPGMGTSGLYYYFHTMTKALDALGEEEFEAADGKHAWRIEIFGQLKKGQQENGSWVNPDARWMEGDSSLVTGYALLTLGYLKPKSIGL